MPKNKTLAELRPLVPKIENLVLNNAGRTNTMLVMKLTLSDFRKYCRSLASDAALKKLES